MRFEWSLKLRWQRLKVCTANCRINNQPNEPVAPRAPPELPRFSPARRVSALPLPTEIKRILIYRAQIIINGIGQGIIQWAQKYVKVGWDYEGIMSSYLLWIQGCIGLESHHYYHNFHSLQKYCQHLPIDIPLSLHISLSLRIDLTEKWVRKLLSNSEKKKEGTNPN